MSPSQVKVIIVGNGPSILDNKNGHKIDAFDVVVRINNFQTIGFEEYSGFRRDVLFTCRLNEFNSAAEISSFREVIISLLMNPLDGVTISEKILEHPNITTRIDWPHVYELGMRAGIVRPQYPSTGLICIDYMIRRYGAVTITGFDFFKRGNGHYFSKEERKSPPRHNGLKEKQFVLQLQKEGKLSFLK